MRQLGTMITLIAVLLCGHAQAAKTWYVDPKAGKSDGAGTQESPWRTLAEAVSKGQLRRVEPGDTVLLRSGYHGDVKISGDNAEVITIAAEKGAKPTLSRLTITSGSKWRVRGLTVSPSFGEKPYKGHMVTVAEGGPSSDLAVEDCFVYTALDASKWDAAQWMSANSGILMGRHGKKITLRNNYVLNTRFGINLCSENSVCEGNVISDFSGDGIRVTRDGLTVQHNVIKNIYVGAKDGDRNHDDGIQCFLFNKGHGTLRRAKVVGNIIINREDANQKWPTGMQGIGFFDGPLVDFVVTDNVVAVDHWHGVSLYDAQGCRIERNVAWNAWGKRMATWVRLGGKVGEGNVVRGNYACSFRLGGDGVTASDNKPCTERIYRQALEKALKTINEKYGRVHPAAGCARLGKRKAPKPLKE